MGPAVTVRAMLDHRQGLLTEDRQPGHRPSQTARWRGWWSWPVQAFVAVAVAGVIAHGWQLIGRGHMWWPDSDAYLATSESSLFSLDLWAGARPAGVPLLLKLVGGDGEGFVYGQAVVATLCWATLAASVATVLRSRWAWLVVGAIAALLFTHPVATWQRTVLSESLALSCLALVVAAGIQLARGVTGWRVALFLAALGSWLVVRDTHTSVALLLGAGCAAWWVFGRPRFELRRAVLALGIVTLVIWASGAAERGQRYSYPLRNVYAVRVLPYPDRVAWFADHGMPQSADFTDPWRPLPGDARIFWVPEGEPAFRRWERWLDRDGRSTFLRWVATHPGYLFDEPRAEPERTFNNGFGDLSYYQAPDMRWSPPVTWLLLPPRLVALAIAVAATAWAARRGRWRTPVFVVGTITAALAAPHGLVAWHSDGQEVMRHLVVPVVQFHLGVLLMVAGALAGDRRSSTSGWNPGGGSVMERGDGHHWRSHGRASVPATGWTSPL